MTRLLVTNFTKVVESSLRLNAVKSLANFRLSVDGKAILIPFEKWNG